jgi:hypothetical protein
MDYSYGLVAFIDILGIKEKTLSESFNDINLIYNNFYLAFEKYMKETEYAFGKQCFTSFSDSIYIAFEIKHENKWNEKLLMLINLHTIARTILSLPFKNILVRGGISYNKVHIENEKNILFGSAIIQAYELERKAQMPRIVIEDKLAEELIAYYNSIKDNTYLYLENIIIKDEFDDSYILNILDKNICKEDNFKSIYLTVKYYSENNIKEHMNDHTIIAKHKWFLNYLENEKIKRNIDIL